MGSNLPVFIAAALVLLLTPGPAVLYIIARSIDQGRTTGLVSVLGVQLGNSVHAIAAALGLSAILVTSALLFNVVKFAGAAYLIYLGVRTLMKPVSTETAIIGEKKTLKQTFWQGVMVAVLNPKTALFFLAFLPQFVDSSRGNVGLQVLMLGIIFVSMAMCTDGMYAILSGTAGRWLRYNRWFMNFQRYFAGTVYIGLGMTAALTGHRK
jgi:threonine/homoserine/homoserine lactone efflux protein